jgi:hypothetical protein
VPLRLIYLAVLRGFGWLTLLAPSHRADLHRARWTWNSIADRRSLAKACSSPRPSRRPSRSACLRHADFQHVGTAISTQSYGNSGLDSGGGDQDDEEPGPVTRSTSDATVRDVCEACWRSAPCCCGSWGTFLYILRAGPAGSLRPPSGPATTRRSPGRRPHPLHRASDEDEPRRGGPEVR